MHIIPDTLIGILADQPALLADYEAAGKPRKADLMYEYMTRYNQAAVPR